MAGIVPRVKHLVMEIRYLPTLAFYGVMDRIGLHFASEYPDWERSPLTLEIRDKKNRRRAAITHTRSFFEAIDPFDVHADVERAMKIFERLQSELGFTKILRVGLRQWAAVVVPEKLEKVVRDLSKKLHPQGTPLIDKLQGNVFDFMYAVNVQTDHAWKYYLKVGPMERRQWFELIPYEQALFAEGAFEEFKNSLPENMVFFDIDGMREDFAYSDLNSVAADIRRGADTVLTNLANYLLG
jgi:hypothetical protein